MQVGSVGTNDTSSLFTKTATFGKQDAQTKRIQNQINQCQKQLQQLSEKSELSTEDQMKKRQEINQQINDLNNQLRQHQMQLKQQQQEKNSSMNDMLGGNSNKPSNSKGKKDTGMSAGTMGALISGDTAVKQAEIQGGVATKIEGKTNVLEMEIKLDGGRGGNTESKQAELAKLEERAQEARIAQFETLGTIDEEIEEDNDNEKVKEDKPLEEQSNGRKLPTEAVQYPSVDIKL